MKAEADLDQNPLCDLEKSLRQDVLRAAEAENLLKNDLLSQAFNDVDSDLIARWKKTDLFDVETRESVWREAKILGDLKAKIESHIQTGALAKAKALSLMQRVKSLF